MGEHPLLDNPAWHALGGPQARFGVSQGGLRRYLAPFAPFAAAASRADGAGLAAFLPAGEIAVFIVPEPVDAPDGLETVLVGSGLQMVADEPRLVPAKIDARVLGSADVPAVLDIVERTQPGPFAARTIELGRYLGVFDGDRLVAVSGERMRLDGYTEVSAVCTHPDYRGRGLGKQLVSVICAGILARGETPFLHVRADNAEAIGMYRRLGFAVRTPVRFTVLRHRGEGEERIPTFLRGSAGH